MKPRVIHTQCAADVPTLDDDGRRRLRVEYTAEVDHFLVEYTAEVEYFLVLRCTSTSGECCLPARLGEEINLEIPAGATAEDVATRWLENCPEFWRSCEEPPQVVVCWRPG